MSSMRSKVKPFSASYETKRWATASLHRLAAVVLNGRQTVFQPAENARLMVTMSYAPAAMPEMSSLSEIVTAGTSTKV